MTNWRKSYLGDNRRSPTNLSVVIVIIIIIIIIDIIKQPFSNRPSEHGVAQHSARLMRPCQGLPFRHSHSCHTLCTDTDMYIQVQATSTVKPLATTHSFRDGHSELRKQKCCIVCFFLLSFKQENL